MQVLLSRKRDKKVNTTPIANPRRASRYSANTDACFFTIINFNSHLIETRKNLMKLSFQLRVLAIATNFLSFRVVIQDRSQAS